jgi:hypothetical protein
MANRTVKFIGMAQSETGADNVNITFTFNGVTVFDSTVPVTNAETGEKFALFEFDIDQTIAGNVPTSLTSSDGIVTAVTLVATHTRAVSISGWTDSDGNVQAPITAWDTQNTYENLGAGDSSPGDEPKTNIVINGETFNKGEVGDLVGAWNVEVPVGQTMSCDYDIVATPS